MAKTLKPIPHFTTLRQLRAFVQENPGRLDAQQVKELTDLVIHGPAKKVKASKPAEPADPEPEKAPELAKPPEPVKAKPPKAPAKV